MATGTPSILDDPIAQLLPNGEANTPSEAERIYLERHVDEVFGLVNSPLTEEEFRSHPLIQLLFSYGSRGCEDSLR
jgi:hypothetical protein